MIPKPNLDDRTFQDIVDDAIRLIPQYCPEWNNFNPTDPGVTLVELFAWMTEMVLYRLNRVPEKNLLTFLELMGVEPTPPHPSSTILVFSIAFGISVDDTIHFLAKYRQELRASNWNINSSVLAAIRETGISMLYTSIILFFGFSVFIASSFGGTVSLGILVSITLIIAMLSNLLLLPSLLMSLEKLVTNKEFNRPIIRLYKDNDDEDDEDEENEDLSESEEPEKLNL